MLDMDHTSIQQHLVLVGGGHAHLQVLRQLAMHPLRGLRVTLISQEIETAYSGMLPGYIAGHYAWEDMHIDLMPLCAQAGVNFIHDTVTGLDAPSHKLQLADRPDMAFDILSINIGSSNKILKKNEKNNQISIRPIRQFLAYLDKLSARARQSDPMDIAIIGGGAGGIEVALALRNRLQNEVAGEPPRMRVVSASSDCLPNHHPNVQFAALAQVERAGIEWVPDFKVVSVKDNSLQAEDGRQLGSTHIIWATGATAQPWVAQSGLPVDDQGFILVDEHLACVGVPRIFAVGDIATMARSPRPKAGVFAVRQGQILRQNLYRRLLGQPLLVFEPQKHFLSILALGKKSALANRDRFCLRGGWVWHWKDWLDRRFVNSFRLKSLPGMDSMQGRAMAVARRVNASMSVRQDMNTMHCGGCGSKLPAEMLNRVLNKLDLVSPDGKGAGDDAAILDIPAGSIVQSFDGFRAMLPDAYLMGRIAAAHALNDIYAMGAQPLYALASVTLPWARAEITEDQLVQVLSGALAVFNEEQVVLAGGHSEEGPELHVGFVVTGRQEEEQALWRKVGMGARDRLILTKPIGAGALFAAHAKGLCKGRWLTAAVAELVRSNQRAVSILRQYGAQACTDITGFGLLGHALEMAQASARQLAVAVFDVPVLEGSIACLTDGTESSLQQANERVLKEVALNQFSRSDPRVRVLMDPMTAGGLLASLPASEAEPCLAALQRAGYQAGCIGRVLEDDSATVQLVPHLDLDQPSF